LRHLAIALKERETYCGRGSSKDEEDSSQGANRRTQSHYQKGIKNGHETLRERELGACRARVRQGSPASGRPARAGPRGGTRNFNFLQLAAGPPKRPACRDSIQISPCSKLPPSGPTAPCALSRRAPAHLLRWRTTSQKVQRETRKSDRPNCAPLLSGSSELAAYKKDPSSPIQKLASKTRTIIAPKWLRNWAHRVSKHVRHQTCTQKPHGCASLLLRATLGLRIHWDPLVPSRGPVLYMWRARDRNGGQFTTRKSLQRGAHLRGSSLHLRGKEQIQKVPRNRYSKIEPTVSASYRGFSQLCAPKVLRALRIVSYI